MAFSSLLREQTSLISCAGNSDGKRLNLQYESVGLASTEANAGAARKICKQGLMTHPMAGKHRDLMKQCKAEYKAYKKAGGARAT
jgi:hypothetical protein